MEQGLNDFGKIGYNGPAPPPGKMHRYHYRLLVLDTALSMKQAPNKDAFLAAIRNHTLAGGELVGKYSR
jgi:phosphatidylethanolamine-binding protein (PEBP) family uncharacterized protein